MSADTTSLFYNDHSDKSNASAHSDGAGSVQERSLNEVLDEIPLGWFHYRLLIVCGLAYTADAMEVSLLSFVATCAGIDWDLTDNQIASITSVVFAGELLGSMFWGPMADRYGRRVCFLCGSAVIAISGFLSGVSPSYSWLLFFRGLVGFGVGGLIVPFDILAEFMPVANRGQFCLYIMYFWTLGSIFVAAMAWVFLSTEGWRYLTFLTAIPVALAAVASVCLLPESPRWLVVQGRIEDAEKVLRDAATVNGTNIIPFTLSNKVNEDEIVSVMELLKPDMARVSIPLWIAWLCFGFCYYGVILFVTRVFDTHEQIDDADSDSCSFDYAAIFTSATSEIVGIAITVYFVDNWGRVSSQMVMFFGAAIGVFCMGLRMPQMALVFVSIFARLTAVGANSSVWVITPELYSTEFRATAHSVANCFARIGAFLSPYLVESTHINKVVIGLVLALMNLVGMTAAFLLPETLGKDLDSGIGSVHTAEHKLAELVSHVLMGSDTSGTGCISMPSKVDDRKFMIVKNYTRSEEEL